MIGWYERSMFQENGRLWRDNEEPWPLLKPLTSHWCRARMNFNQRKKGLFLSMKTTIWLESSYCLPSTLESLNWAHKTRLVGTTICIPFSCLVSARKRAVCQTHNFLRASQETRRATNADAFHIIFKIGGVDWSTHSYMDLFVIKTSNPSRLNIFQSFSCSFLS